MIVRIRNVVANCIFGIYRLGTAKKAKKIRALPVINVLFVVNDISKWKTESLYREMLAHDRFNPVIGLTLRMEETPISTANKLIETKKYLEENGLKYIELFGPINPRPNIVLYSEPYISSVPLNQSVFKYLDALFINANYSCHTTHLHFDYFETLQKISWIDCFEDELSASEAFKYIGKKRKNICITGLPLADLLLSSPGHNPWKRQDKPKKKIIWAPHHSISTLNNIIMYSNFLEIADEMLRIAEQYSDEYQFAFKPHPLLKEKLERTWGTKRTQEYFNKWSNLPNGQLAEGAYIDLFKYSDALIHDCSSFIVEYLYMDKPVFFLANNIESILKDMNEFGKLAFYCQEVGHSTDSLKAFLNRVLKGEDKLKNERNDFFKRHLLPPNGKTASLNIIDRILGV